MPATKKKPRSAPEAERERGRLLDIEEAADYCGVKLRTMRTAREKREVRCYMPGRSLLFRRSDLDAWIESKEVLT